MKEGRFFAQYQLFYFRNSSFSRPKIAYNSLKTRAPARSHPRGEFSLIRGDIQVEPTVTIIVATADPHTSLLPPRNVQGHTARQAHFSEVAGTLILKEEIRRN